MTPAAGSWPVAPLTALDTVWLQVAGTLCNLQCTHCFISCSPHNHAHEMMTLAQVRATLEESARLGVKEYYLTGGEPFMNPEILPMLEAVLKQGPATVLTNGVLIRQATASRLRELADGTGYSLDVRISLDGWDEAGNDAIRGAGTFARILEGVGHLAAAGLAPILTVTEACEGAGSREGRLRFLELMRERGLPHPRLKVMPLLRLGAEEARGRAYDSWETLRGRELTPEETAPLVCSSGRMVTSRGVWVCPILLDSPGARMGATLEETLRPFTLSSPACFTCHEMGLTCTT